MSNAKTAGIFSGIGAAVGGITHLAIGGAGLAVTGTAVGLAAPAFLTVGAVAGLAAFGLSKALEDKEND